MTTKKNILIISYSPLHRDPRILRQIQALKDDYNLQTVGFTNPNINGVDFFELPMLPLSKTYIQKFYKAFRIMFQSKKRILSRVCSTKHLCSYKYNKPDCIFANDWNGLYAAKILKDKNGWSCKVYFDAHEYFPLYRENFKWKFFEKPLIEYAFNKAKKYISIMSTVCPTLANMYDDYFGFEKGFVRVITNSPDFEPDLKPVKVGEKIRMIHHGAAMRARNLETMIDVMEYLPSEKYELNFMLVQSDKGYYEELIKRASKYKNINFLDPVPFDKIPEFTNQFDIGLFILNNKIVNYKFALPNKFFEFVQARLAIAIGDSPEMRNYLEKYNLGVSAKSNSPKALAEEILKLSKDDIYRFKQNAHKYAKELSAENHKKLLKEIAVELSK